jgi:hypothetical protein
VTTPILRPAPEESLQRTDDADSHIEAIADDLSWRIDAEEESQVPKSIPMISIDMAPVDGEFWAAATARCTSKVNTVDGTEYWRTIVEVMETNTAEDLGTLTTRELSDIHEQDILFVDPSLTNAVRDINPKLLPWADTETDPLLGASMGLTSKMCGNVKVKAPEIEPNAKELKTETAAEILFETPGDTLTLSTESDVHTELWHDEASKTAALDIDREPMLDPTVCKNTAPVDGASAFVKRWIDTTSQVMIAGPGNTNKLAWLRTETTNEFLP